MAFTCRSRSFTARGERREAIKVLFFDGSGMCVFYKRLDRGVFRLPEPLVSGEATVVIDERALDDLLDGIDVQPGEEGAGALTNQSCVVAICGYHYRRE